VSFFVADLSAGSSVGSSLLSGVVTSGSSVVFSISEGSVDSVSGTSSLVSSESGFSGLNRFF